MEKRDSVSSNDYILVCEKKIKKENMRKEMEGEKKVAAKSLFT